MSEAKTIFITGATAGFGAAIARKFAASGWRVVATGRRQDRLDALAEELAPHTDIHVVPLDVRDREAVHETVTTLPEPFRAVHTLVNNAGLALGLEPAQDCNLDDWETMVDTNIKGLLYVTRALLPALIEAKSGVVVNLGSIAAYYPYPGGNVYGGTKAFVDQFSLNLRNDLAGTGVRVTCLAPGMAETEFSMVRFSGDKVRADAVYDGYAPLTAEDIAETTFWVANAPAHVNYNIIEIMPTSQTWSPFTFHRPT